MEIWCKDSGLSIFLSSTEAYFFDAAGRFYAAWDQGRFVSHGLSGRSVARRWVDGRRHIRSLKPDEVRDQQKKSQKILDLVLTEDISTAVRQRIRRCLVYERSQDIARFQSLYRPVGILPPDQYGACVVQITEGCGWNQCKFCSFYRNQPYRVKGRDQIRAHVRQVGEYFADGLSLRRSIFLGDANALAASVEDLLYGMEVARRELVPRMTQFRGFYSFNEVTDSSCQSEGDFRLLRDAGLQRIYYGLETGQAELRARLGKPGSLSAIAESVQRAKAAGVLVSLIILGGAGGRAWAKQHAQDSIGFVKTLPLDDRDIVYLSPLYGPDGTAEPPLSAAEMDAQILDLRRALAGQARIAPYDIREFVY